MAKYTRNSYKRKIIMFGVMIFISIALISTGFAAWVLSTQTSNSSDGNVTVGVVENKSFEIEFTEITDQYGNDLTTTDSEGKKIADTSKMLYSFEPKKEDNTGRVRWDGTNCENLSITFKGTVTNYQYLGSFNIKMTMSSKVKALVENSANYINAPACATDSGVEFKTGLVASEDGKATFEYTISFTWGTAFGNMNPSEYYDSDETGSTVSDDAVKETLEAFYAALDTSDTKFTITFTAVAN